MAALMRRLVREAAQKRGILISKFDKVAEQRQETTHA
jgi:hypothetical protein